MKEIIEKLTIMKEDIDCDISASWMEESEKSKFIRQSIALASAIGILSTIGKNNNIKE